jgi:hypothetical protein
MLMVVQRPKVDDQKKRQGCVRQSLATHAGAARPNATTMASALVTAILRRVNLVQRIRKNAHIRRQRQQVAKLIDVKVQRRQLVKRYVEAVSCRTSSRSLNTTEDSVRLIMGSTG